MVLEGEQLLERNSKAISDKSNESELNLVAETAAGTLAAALLAEHLRKGGTTYIPALDITLTAADLEPKTENSHVDSETSSE